MISLGHEFGLPGLKVDRFVQLSNLDPWISHGNGFCALQKTCLVYITFPNMSTKLSNGVHPISPDATLPHWPFSPTFPQVDPLAVPTISEIVSSRCARNAPSLSLAGRSGNFSSS